MLKMSSETGKTYKEAFQGCNFDKKEKKSLEVEETIEEKLTWNFGGELEYLGGISESFTPYAALTRLFQHYLNCVGNKLSIKFSHEKTKSPSEFGVETSGRCKLAEGIELIVSDAWSYHIVSVFFASEEVYLKNADILLEAAKIPGVRAKGHCIQKEGYRMLKDSIKEIRDFTPEQIADREIKREPSTLHIMKKLHNVSSDEEARQSLIDFIKSERKTPVATYHIDGSEEFIAALGKFKEFSA